MKKKLRIVIFILCIVAAVTVIVCNAVPFGLDETVETMLKAAITRFMCLACFILILIFLDYFKFSNARITGKTLLLCLPFILVAVNNFPYTAYFGGLFNLSFTTEQIIVYALMCVSVGCFEEICFRGLLTVYLIKRYATSKIKLVASILVASALFGLVHLVNLAEGAGFGSTIMQVGYSFLIGAMLSMCLIISRNVWLCAGIHCVFNFCGTMLNYFVESGGQTLDTATIVITVVLAVIVLAYSILYILKLDLNRLQNDFEIKSIQSNQE